MAMTEEESRRLAEALMTLSETTGKQTESAKLFNARMDQATKTVGSLADAFVTYNKEIYKGSSGAKAFSSSLDKMGEAATAAAAGLALLVPGGPLMKAVVAGLGLLAAKFLEAGKVVAEQTDEIYKAFQGMAKLGAAGGMQDVFDGLMKVGLGTEKFADYIKMVNENATDLAAFSGTVQQGRKIFENTMASMSTEQRVQMEQMGLDRKAQSEAVMTYVRQQRLLTAGTKTQMDLSSAAVMRYIKETDELTRITGANREEQQKLLDKAMSEEIFAAFIDELESQGEEGKERAKIAKQANIMAEKLYGPEVARGLRDATTGFVGSSKASEKFFMTFGAEGQEFTDRLRNTTQTTAEMQKGFGKMAQGGANVYEQFRGLAQMGATEDVLLPVREIRKSAGILGQNIEKAGEDARTELAKQLADPDTKKMAEQENKARQTQITQQQTINLGMSKAIEIMDIAAEKNKLAADAAHQLAVQAKAAAEALGKIAITKKEMQRSPGAAASAAAAASEAQRITAEQARNVLEGGSARDIKAFGGKEYLESVIKKSSTTTQDDLSKMGLKIKQGDVHKEGSSLSPKLVELAKQIQEAVPGFGYFSGFNDKFHQENASGSKHTQGLAADFTLGQAPSREQGQEIVAQLKSLGASYVQDEYNNPSSRATAGHFHVEVPQFGEGGNLRGLGIVGERGPELAVGSGSITSNNDIMGAFRDMIGLLEQNQMTLRDIANNSKSTADISDRMLRVAQN